jgi:hypothetical protein
MLCYTVLGRRTTVRSSPSMTVRSTISEAILYGYDEAKEGCQPT